MALDCLEVVLEYFLLITPQHYHEEMQDQLLENYIALNLALQLKPEAHYLLHTLNRLFACRHAWPPLVNPVEAIRSHWVNGMTMFQLQSPALILRAYVVILDLKLWSLDQQDMKIIEQALQRASSPEYVRR